MKNDLAESEKYNESLESFLSSYDVGAKLRRLRLRKKIGLVDLGKHTGLSASLLSKLENGKAVPTLSTLARIAMVFDVGIEYFFDSQRSRRMFVITRARERLRFPDRADNPVPAYFFEVLAFGAKEKRLSAYLAEFPPHKEEELRDHFHEGWELVHVLSGSLAIRFESEEHLLESGDSVYFDALEPHAYRGDSDPPAQAIVVTTRPQM
ncbi:MAG: cupin domain-containing protein [Acidobacteriaceae bacterium]|nr:cupin domain-containing protein [Acidobacteriaceae bacterium]